MNLDEGDFENTRIQADCFASQKLNNFKEWDIF